MFVDDQTYKRNNRTYRRTLLRVCVRDPETKRPKNITIANLSQATDAEIEAIKFALKNADNPSLLKSINEMRQETGKSVGSVAVLSQIADRLGISAALGKSEEGKLAMVMVISRLLGINSRLATVRAANTYALREVTGAPEFDEGDLYRTLDWLHHNQSRIEKKLFKKRKVKGTVYLYDLTSSYLEGEKNELAEFGYSRDKKREKKQLTFGLLCDEEGMPVSVQAFKGNMHDNKTVKEQVMKLKERFGCKYVTFVGDKGMIRSGEMPDCKKKDLIIFQASLRPRIRSLEKKGVIQYELFEEQLVEVEDPQAKVRYILRRNPYLKEQQHKTRQGNIEKLKAKVKESNEYLAEHPGAKVETLREAFGGFYCKA